jgi:hypothetical protein
MTGMNLKKIFQNNRKCQVLFRNFHIITNDVGYWVLGSMGSPFLDFLDFQFLTTKFGFVNNGSALSLGGNVLPIPK